jgi:ribosomal protein S18 acetylase RimI-like enzyme
MNETVQIRPFNRPDDYGAVFDLWNRSGPGVHVGRSDTFDEITKKLTRDPDLFLVAECKGEIIGSVIGGYDGRRALVYHLAVLKEHRQRGIGKALMETLEKLLREKGCSRSYLLITKDNPAVEFYVKQGWQVLDLYALGKDLQ